MTTAVLNLADPSRPSLHRVRRGQILMIALIAAVSLVVLLQLIPTSPGDGEGASAEPLAGVTTLLMFVGVAAMTLVAVAAVLVSSARRARD